MKTKRKKITAIDIAKALGVEKEYRDQLEKEELDEAYNIIMGNVYTPIENTEKSKRHGKSTK
jgi:hypothetical protein